VLGSFVFMAARTGQLVNLGLSSLRTRIAQRSRSGNNVRPWHHLLGPYGLRNLTGTTERRGVFRCKSELFGYLTDQVVIPHSQN
jgi:hypothetical protein